MRYNTDRFTVILDDSVTSLIGVLNEKGLYPRSDTKVTAKLTRDKVSDSKINSEEINCRWAAMYLAHAVTTIK